MKHSNKILGAMLLATAALATSCVDDDKLGYAFEKPASIAGMEYLADYDALKTYVNRSEHPNFKLGVALAASDYNADGLVTRLANSNYDEMTAGNAMKYASCVKDDGKMDFGTVEAFVNNAKENGITIYGHTLAWHSQQNNNYLNGIIAAKEIEVDPDAKVDKIDYEKDWSTAPGYSFWAPDEVKANIKVNTVEGALQIDNAKAIDNWMVQYHVADGLPTVAGNTYKLKMTIKATGQGTMNWGVGGWGGRAEGSFGFDTEWKEFEKEFVATADGGFVLCQTGQFVGSIYIKNVQITHSESPVMEVFKDFITNGEMESGKSMANFTVAEAGKGQFTPTAVAGGPEGKNCIVIHGNANAANEWDTQFFITTPNKAWTAGEEYKISFYYKASENINSATQCHDGPGGYIHWQCLPSDPQFTTSWQKYEMKGTIPSAIPADREMHTIAFNLNIGKVDHPVNYYFADVHWGIMEKTNKIELTDEEKKDTLTWAMDQWITGMMKATNGYVTSWDVVNEPLAGDDLDGDGKYDLQSATRGTVSEKDAANNFYWQDYLGDVDYVRTAVKLARQRFAENGGEGELKLFINDYNLESDWDDNMKAKSLVKWIEEWEKDGTKIDGIGTQMHISYYANEATRNSKFQHIVKMFEILAASGKLVKISELDLGYVDADGNLLKTQDLTDEQHREMSEYYKNVIAAYFKYVPAAQQYGITNWCITDAPANSGWRAGEPVGLWDSNYNRKHCYAGFADGLAGKGTVE